jgi:hypothetical protein
MNQEPAEQVLNNIIGQNPFDYYQVHPVETGGKNKKKKRKKKDKPKKKEPDLKTSSMSGEVDLDALRNAALMSMRNAKTTTPIVDSKTTTPIVDSVINDDSSLSSKSSSKQASHATLNGRNGLPLVTACTQSVVVQLTEDDFMESDGTLASTKGTATTSLEARIALLKEKIAKKEAMKKEAQLLKKKKTADEISDAASIGKRYEFYHTILFTN